MKKTLLLSMLFASAVGVFAQGTVNFANTVAFGTAAQTSTANGHADRLVYGTDNTTGLSGTNWVAQLYWAAGSGVADSSLAAVDASPKTFFASGSQLGKWIPATKTMTPTAQGDTVTLQVRVWDGSLFSTYALAATAATSNPLVFTGKSPTFSYSIPTGGTPPVTAFYMEGLQSFTIGNVPEPTTIALGVLGAASLFVVRRRK